MTGSKASTHKRGRALKTKDMRNRASIALGTAFIDFRGPKALNDTPWCHRHVMFIKAYRDHGGSLALRASLGRPPGQHPRCPAEDMGRAPTSGIPGRLRNGWTRCGGRSLREGLFRHDDPRNDVAEDSPTSKNGQHQPEDSDQGSVHFQVVCESSADTCDLLVRAGACKPFGIRRHRNRECGTAVATEIHTLGIFSATLGTKHFSPSSWLTAHISVYGLQDEIVPSASA